MDEFTIVARGVDSRTASSAEIQAMHASAIYGRAEPPRFDLLEAAPDGNYQADRWRIGMQVSERLWVDRITPAQQKTAP